MDEHVKMSYLMDIYSPLLTDKQAKVLEYYYSDDLALSEIAALLEISRQGVHDALSRARNTVLAYDEKLGLFDKYIKNSELIDRIEQLSDNREIDSLLDEIRNNL